MNCGMRATIIEYKNKKDITVQFEDGTIIEHKYYKNFRDGIIAHPKISPCGQKSINGHIIIWYLSKIGFQEYILKNFKELKHDRIKLQCYNSNLKVAIEYDCKNWHTAKKHIDADIKKNQLCKEAGITLIRVREPGLPEMNDCENIILDTTGLFSQNLEEVLNILIYRMNTFVDVNFERDKESIVEDFAQRHHSSRVGEMSVATSGEMMKIIAYRKSNDIDIKFEDGTVVMHKSYDAFKEGSISKFTDRAKIKGEKRIGEQRKMNCGMIGTIIEYNNCEDITVRFEDNAIAEHKDYEAFIKGQIPHPIIGSHRNVSINEHIILWYLKELGFKRLSHDYLRKLGFGQLELDCYNPILKIAIEYDGVRWHKNKDNVKRDERKNSICKQNNIHLIRIREPGLEPMENCENIILDTANIFSQSLENSLKILVNRMSYLSETEENNKNISIIDINFARDKEKIMDSFSTNHYSDRVGEKSISSKGEAMEIIVYRHVFDIDIRFEDGTVLKHRRYDHFKSGQIAKESGIDKDKKGKRLGERKLMNCGKYATIITYRNCDDIDVQFDDGIVVYNRKYSAFFRGTIKHPNSKTIKHSNIKATTCKRDVRIGETNLATNGQKMTIIEYKNNKDITIQFEDGYIVEHILYKNFQSGKIKNPNFNKKAS